jgi:bifunctional non-homologous end joining protein LigD
VVDDIDSLLCMVEVGAVDLHVWPSRCETPASPDYLVFDRDPAGEGKFTDVVDASLAVRGALETLGIESYPRTTGATGYMSSCRSRPVTRTPRRAASRPSSPAH